MSFHGPRRQTLAIALLPLENAETDRMQWHADHAEQHTVVRKGLAEIGRRAHGATNEFIRDSRSAGQSVPRKNKWNYTLASSSFFSQNL